MGVVWCNGDGMFWIFIWVDFIELLVGVWMNWMVCSKWDFD